MHEQKVNAFQKAFFSKSSSTNLNNISSTRYPESISYEKQITIRQIREIIAKLAPKKASEPDEITNRMLINTL